MLSILALALAAASSASPALTSNSPWWEKVTVTMTSDGAQQSCKYESNLPGGSAQSCDVEQASATARPTSAPTSAAYTRITFERRFTPDAQPDIGSLENGDKLLAAQVLALAIDADGAVRSCEPVAAAGEARPAYGCDEARSERFQASVGGSASQRRQGYLTILVYGHSEQLA